MKSIDNKLIIYDSNCKVCSTLRDVVLKFTTVPDAAIKAYKDLPPDLISVIDPLRFKNEMALIEPGGGKTLYGADGVAYIFSSQYRVVDLLLRYKPLFQLFSFLYKTQAYNRYIMATPKSSVKCDCAPDRILRYRLSYIFMTLALSIILTALFGISLKDFFHLTPGYAALQMLLIAGTGWLLQGLWATIRLSEKALDYVGHLGSIMIAGLLVLTPWIILHSLTGLLLPFLPAVSVIASSGCMLYLHFYRVRYLEISQWWTISWFLLLQSTALFWVYFFHFN